MIGNVQPSFEELVADAEAVDVSGWDFSWLDGRATEQRPSWGYQRLLKERLAQVQSALDLWTGGGEVLAGAAPLPPTMAATEPWPPNIGPATELLHPLGAVLVATGDEPPLPFADNAFELVTSRHPSFVWWDEFARVLKPAGTYFAQHVGIIYLRTLREHFLGPQPNDRRIRGQLNVDTLSEEVTAAGLELVDLRHEEIKEEFFDVGAVVYFLRKLSWVVPDFSVAKYRDKLRTLHDQINADGSFITYSSRVLVEARKPGVGPSQ
jgi:SAM-dependent methyltransferase